MERTVHLQENLLGQIFSLIESASETISEIVNALVMLMDDLFPRIAISLETFRQQFRVCQFS